ncbi:MAG: hypothetical protein IJ805_07585 [Lachnospiraceae bacterium]|nr:hypothetical protein [Lachnospiraceae bacterium]
MSENKNNEIKTDMKEEEVFSQKVSDDELSKVAGGNNAGDEPCIQNTYRDIHNDGCATTVGDGSWCSTNDACVVNAIMYYNMENCHWSNCRKARD